MKINDPEALIMIKEKEYKELLQCREQLNIIKSQISILNNYINFRRN